jgi:hypothetical protein
VSNRRCIYDIEHTGYRCHACNACNAYAQRECAACGRPASEHRWVNGERDVLRDMLLCPTAVYRERPENE